MQRKTMDVQNAMNKINISLEKLNKNYLVIDRELLACKNSSILFVSLKNTKEWISFLSIDRFKGSLSFCRISHLEQRIAMLSWFFLLAICLAVLPSLFLKASSFTLSHKYMMFYPSLIFYCFNLFRGCLEVREPESSAILWIII